LSQAPPYSDITADGTPDGYLPSLTAAVFAELGVEDLCPELTTFDAMIPGLQAGRFDVLPGGLNITEERCEQILFSQPVTLQYEALGVPAGNPASLSDYASIAADPSLTLAVFSGSSQEAFALAQGVSSDQLLTVPDSQSGVEAVEVGRADAFGAGQFTLELSFADSPIDVLVDRASNPSMIGIGFRQDAAEVRDLFDEQLEVLRSSGELGELYASFGFPNPDDLAGIARGDVAATCS
jgi:polar amino acid transport system substrate-binding protein